MNSNQRSSLGWRLFTVLLALLVLIGEIPMLVRAPSLTLSLLLRVLVDLVTVIGVAEFAFRRSVAPTLFWRVYAVLYCAWALMWLARSAPLVSALATRAAGSYAYTLGLIVWLAVPVLIVGFTGLALLHRGELVGPRRRPLGARPAPPTEQYSLPLSG